MHRKATGLHDLATTLIEPFGPESELNGPKTVLPGTLIQRLMQVFF